MTTVDNQIDQTTGTIRIRATFDNKTGDLFPNEFVNARLLVEEIHGAVLIPIAAIQRTTNSAFVYLIGSDSKVKVRTITIGLMEGDDAQVTSGLNPGDVVVLTGVDKLDNGTLVNPQIQDKRGQGK